MEELIDKNKAKKRKANISKNNIFETTLNGVKTMDRQGTIKNLKKDDPLKIDSFFTDGILGFEVFSSEDKSIGIIPSNISKELELSMEEGLEPFIKNYKLIEGEDGVINCDLILGFNKP